jgi:hypothetical protein
MSSISPSAYYSDDNQGLLDPHSTNLNTSVSTSILSSKVIIPDGADPDPDCVCRTVMAEKNAMRCSTCSGLLKPIFQIEQDRISILSNLAESRRKLDEALHREVLAAQETTRTSSRVEELEDLMDSRADELLRLQRDLQAMGEKVVDEIEKRAELQVSKDALQEELDELTKSLFEEANVLVADEARRRHLHEMREKSLEQEIEEMKRQLNLEQLQLKELKIKMAEVTSVEEEASAVGVVADESMEVKSVDGIGTLRSYGDPIDPQLLLEFQDFLKQGPTVKLNKLHTISFMKNILEDDVTPCLRFGGNPRTSTRRLVDSIVQNSCFVEEMSPSQIASLQAQHAALKELSEPSISPSTNARRAAGVVSGGIPQTETEKAIVSTSAPTQAIFQKTVLERLSTWSISSSSSGSTTSNSTSPSTTTSTTALPSSLVINGCSACGKQGPTKHHFKISEQHDDAWCPICVQCRDRLVAVCEFYNFVRHVRQGLYSTRRQEDVYLEVMALKRKMFYARIGAAGYATGPKPFSRAKSILRPDSQLFYNANSKISSSIEPALQRLNEEIPVAPSPLSAKSEVVSDS